MVKASKGIMEKTRQKFRRGPRQRGLSPITRSFQSFEVGERVTIVIDSSLQKGWPHHRFHGMTGTVVGQRGAAFLVDVRFGGRIKHAVVRPEHPTRAYGDMTEEPSVSLTGLTVILEQERTGASQLNP